MSKESYAEALYTLTIPVFSGSLQNLSRIIVKAENHAEQNGINPETLLSARLHPTMFTLLQQIQYACFLPVDFARHFSDEEAPRVGYDETNLGELKSSIDQTVLYLQRIKVSGFREREHEILPVFFDPKLGLPADIHAARITVPDFFFHVTTAYCILRQEGVPLEKFDFLGPHNAEALT
jgi:uncharacterized protein